MCSSWPLQLRKHVKDGILIGEPRSETFKVAASVKQRCAAHVPRISDERAAATARRHTSAENFSPG